MTNPVEPAFENTYALYYWRPIVSMLEEGRFQGLKLALGPTGIGKNHGIPFAIERLREQPVFPGCIYATHRHALLAQAQRDLAERGIPSVYLQSNVETATAFACADDVHLFLTQLDKQGFFQEADMALQAVQELIKHIKVAASPLTSTLKPSDRLLQIARAKIKEERERMCAALIGIFEAGLRATKEQQRAVLLQSLHIWRLFPYVEFLKNPARPVLLVTVSKLLHGFFDGHHRQRITSLKNNIVFLDEFEIQESEILKYMCEHDGIRNSFEFVRLFHQEMATLKRLGYLDTNDQDTTERNEARQTIVQMLDDLEQECQRGGYPNYPAVTRFRMNAAEFRNEQTITIFQSNHIVQTKPFYIVDDGAAWRIVAQKTERAISSLRLLYTVSRMGDRILEFFGKLWSDGLEVEWGEYIDHCYNKHNDNMRGAYQEVISSYGIFRRPMRLLKGQEDEAIRNSIYYKGFSLYKLTTGKFVVTSPEQVEIQQKTLHITPEYILWQLCQNNLVFGISATGDMHRYINAFDMEWIQDHTRYLPVDETDTALIAKLKVEKDASRVYDIHFGFATLLPEVHPLCGFLEALEAEGLFGLESQKVVDARRNLVNRLLETLRWITHESKNVTHLVFVNSFSMIQRVLDKKLTMQENEQDDLTEHLVVRRGREQEYAVTIDGKPCYVILLNAQKAKEHVGAFSYNPARGSLVVVTQYETAANGVNLEWIDIADMAARPHDFQGIHLLEGKHFYFAIDTNEQEARTLDTGKMFAWQAWKLAEGRQISQRHLAAYLQSWKIAEFNANVYKRTHDYLLNQNALFNQAFGRVDRKRGEQHITDVRLSDTSSTGHVEDSVFRLIARYLDEEGAIGQHREDRARYTSTLILNIYDAVRRHSHKQRVSNQFYREDIASVQARSREQIAKLLEIIASMKKGVYSESEARVIKKLWHRIREAMLRQDYQFDYTLRLSDRPSELHISFRRDFVHTTAYLQPKDHIYVDHLHDATTVFRNPSVDTITLDLNWPYRRLAANPHISLFFSTRNYQLRYYHTTPSYMFTPHAMQAILAGAVGEAALQALLERAGIELDDPKEHLTPLFEDFDLKVKGHPIYLDAKSFSRETIFRLNAKPDDPLYNPQLNGPLLLKKAQEKWQRIVASTGETDVKFVIVNLQVDGLGSNEYWDQHLRPVDHFSDSAITIIQGALDSDNPVLLRPAFQLWLDEIRSA